jgi:HTH-like domain
VSRSWFYKWKDGVPGPRAARRRRLTAEITRLLGNHEGKYGSPRITADLRDAGWRVSENTVAGLMRELGLAARRKKKRKAMTRPGKGRWRAPDLVKRDKFDTNKAWPQHQPATRTASARSPRRSPRSARACPEASSSAPPAAAPPGAGATATPPISTAPTRHGSAKSDPGPSPGRSARTSSSGIVPCSITPGASASRSANSRPSPPRPPSKPKNGPPRETTTADTPATANTPL